MRRMLVLTCDKNNAVRLRTLLEKLRLEFEIAIGEETGRTILSERFMDLILLDASAIRAGMSWVFPFLEDRRLRMPVLVLGAAEGVLREAPPHPELIRWIPPPIDQARLEEAIDEAVRWIAPPSREHVLLRESPFSLTTDFGDE